jgi:NADPH2:quinone reductase
MKAILLKEFGSTDNFELADIPIPQLQKGQVRIKIKAVSFNPVDYQVRKGLPESRSMTSNILGKDLSGIIDEVHDDVKEFKKDDEVYSYICNLASSGTYTEYICVPSELVAKKPVSLSHQQAASIPVAAITATLALEKIKANRSKSIFIAGGAGGVGSFAIMFAKQMGIKNIVTTAGNDKSLLHLMQNPGLNKEQIINYKEDKFIEKAIQKNKGHFDSVVDLVGSKMLSSCCELLAIDGNLASVVDAPGKDDFETLFRKNASFHSVGANAYSLSDNRENWKIYRQMLDHISELFDNGSLHEPPVTIVGPLSVETVKKAHELLENNLVQGKLVMTC